MDRVRHTVEKRYPGGWVWIPVFTCNAFLVLNFAAGWRRRIG